MKKLANLKGVKALNKNEQKSINGGFCGDTDYSSCEHIYGCVYLCQGEVPNN